MVKLYRLSVMIAFAFTLLTAKQANDHSQPARQKTNPGGATKAQTLTVDGVLAMVQAGLPDDVIIARVRKQDKPLDLSADDLIRLKKGKVNDSVLKVMLEPLGTAPASQSQTPQPLFVPVPMVNPISGAARSGATPGPGANTVSDPNDPLTPHDSGIYLYTQNRNGAPTMTVLERAAYQGSKMGGMLASAMTYGIKKAKTRAVIPGPRASLRVNDSAPVFYFYFDDKQAGLGKTYFGMNSLSNPNQFVLLKLEVKKADRETVIGQYSALGSSSGSDTNAMIPFKSERIRTGLYKVTISGLKGGEYCFLASSGATSPMIPALGVTGQSSADIFDFGISVQ